MKSLALVGVFAILAVGCGGGNSSVIPPPVPQGSAQISVSLHDMPPAGVTVLSFQATITGIAMQPGNVSMLGAPMTLEMTQLQGMSAYMGTVSVPADTYTGMTITLTNARMTFLNNTGATIGGMMGGGSCANGQICQLAPTMMASSVTVSGAPFPMNVQANSSLNLQMDFDLMDSMQSNMSMNPTMTSTMGQMQNSAMFDQMMDDFLGQVTSVNASGNQFAMSSAQGMPSMTLIVDSNTVFQDFDTISKPNSFAGMAQGQVVLARMRLEPGGTLHADKVRFESATQALDGMIVAINNSTQFDMVVMREAPAMQGVNIGDMVRMNLQAPSMFDIDDMDMPVSGMSFAGAPDLSVGQMIQIEPSGSLVPGTPPQIPTSHIRLMKTWMTAKVASKIDASTFTVNSLPGMFAGAGITAMKVSTSMQTEFDGVSGMSAMNVGDTVTIRGPMFTGTGSTTMMIASRVQKR